MAVLSAVSCRSVSRLLSILSILKGHTVVQRYVIIIWAAGPVVDHGAPVAPNVARVSELGWAESGSILATGFRAFAGD